MNRHRLYLDCRSQEEMIELFEHLVAAGLVPDINVFPATAIDEKKPHISYVLIGDGVRTSIPVRRSGLKKK